MAGVENIIEIQDNESRILKNILNSAPIAIIAVSTDNRIIWINRMAEEIFNQPSDSLLYSNIQNLMQGIDPFINGGINVVLPYKNYLICWKSCLAKNNDGSIIASIIFGMTLDSVSYGTIWRERLEAIRSFVGSYAHDINNLFGAIAGYSSILQTFKGYDEKMLGYLRSLDNSVKKVSELTTKSIKFSAPIKPNKQKMDLKNAIIPICKKWTENHPDFELKINFESSQKQLELDLLMIKESFTAILDNAAESMSNPGTINVTINEVVIKDTRPEILNYPVIGNYIRIEVCDQGEGMDNDTIYKAFMPFYSTRDKGKGSGMGLTIAYTFIDQHNGYLTLESARGKGTTVSIYLPIESPSEKIEIEDISSQNTMTF